MAATATVFLAGTALAAHCPKDAAAIDGYLSKMSVNEMLKGEIVALRDEGMALHTAGKHRGSEAMLANAMRKLLTAQ
ncbi:MAG: hypothetical protein ACTSSQ_05670 [Alphaproteobacteria bacterium]